MKRSTASLEALAVIQKILLEPAPITSRAIDTLESIPDTESEAGAVDKALTLKECLTLSGKFPFSAMAVNPLPQEVEPGVIIIPTGAEVTFIGASNDGRTFMTAGRCCGCDIVLSDIARWQLIHEGTNA